MDYQQWRTIHRQQLAAIPERHHEALFRKLCTETFDAGEHFIMCPSSSGWSIKVSNEEGLKIDDNSIFIIDHSWTYLPDNCHQQLASIPGLATRMANLLDLIEEPTTPTQATPSHSNGEEEDGEGLNGVNNTESDSDDGDDDDPDAVAVQTSSAAVDEEERESEEEEEGEREDTEEEEPPSEELIENIVRKLWRFNDCYTIANMPVPIWYVMEDYAARIQHSLDPNVTIVPFFSILTQMSYSILWPLRDLSYGDTISRNRVPSRATSELEKQCHSLPWLPPQSLPLSDPLWDELDSLPLAPNPERPLEDLPDVTLEFTSVLSPPFKVYTDMDMIKKNLSHPLFELVSDPEKADILWFFDHYKDFKSLKPNQLINQFPCENVLTCKDLLISVARRASKNHAQDPSSLPDWIPESYITYYELPYFVKEYKRREENGEDNSWIVKPWNLGRSMDIFVTSNLSQIIRLSQASPKVVCKYVNNPVLFNREGIGKVKMDVRYIVLLVSVKPLVIYAYNTFWLRFANKPFQMSSFHDYETHFTVMNYKDDSPLKHIESVDFIPLFHEQYPDQSWSNVQDDIYNLIYELFTAAASEEPPAGIKHYPQSRAMYAIDLLLEWSSPDDGCGCQHIQPKICEVNFCPDCNRAIQYHPSFVNDIFETLFIPQARHSEELPVTKITQKK
ncbi:PREDICTED: tubulin--tyrosine ligase-like protein 12 [Amphimedon queenslandica]|uniref:Tubulin--tyrosine ligase-like protein 12 SET-like domain-containing protein n=1 Tax=Amphimedon queenslandica TaxID=400682 RepID=A0A1X7VMN1_AMPQE|nr:PREDICTED: tubulin--tyrosine ligase-like protein 12 [Amphimedon queenslandica]|eukprot:XP_019861207.1 PREDICTED: tubulin--tyrosine ligase-like protein 12 [Amphimedon queenslandica]